mgnify:CR=1 FL=1
MEHNMILPQAGVIPVVVLDDAKDAVPTAKALLTGGVDVMEITFRTAAAAGSIKAVAENCPEMLVGAGTVVTLDQCKQALECGAKFIVSPGFDPEVVSWCVERNIPITPGCVTPTEIMAAMKLGLNVVKFFPAGVYGGLKAMKALSAPFGGIKFIPTGGVDAKNLKEYLEAPFVHAVGGSWLCAKADIAAHNFDKITSLCKEARKTALGFEIAHVGVNAGDAEESLAVCRALDAAFGFGVKEGNSSNFAGSGVEVMKSPYLGKNGHIAVKTNSIPRAAAELAKNGFTLDESTAKYKGEKMVAVYLKQEFGGFAVVDAAQRLLPRAKAVFQEIAADNFHPRGRMADVLHAVPQVQRQRRKAVVLVVENKLGVLLVDDVPDAIQYLLGARVRLALLFVVHDAPPVVLFRILPLWWDNLD